MALIGIQLDRKNPEFNISDFIFWMPQYTKYLCYYEGKILVGQTTQIASVYSNNYYELTIGNKKIELVSADEIIYTGSMTVGESPNQITYSIMLDSSTKVLALNDGSTTTVCTLKSEGSEMFSHLYEISNDKIFYSIYGTDWKLAMSLCIAHYLTLIANQIQAPSGNSLQGIAGGGTYKGILASMSVGDFSKTYDLAKTMVDEEESLFWNATPFGAQLMALLKTKAIPSILVVTSHPIPTGPCYNPFRDHRPPRVPWED